MYQGQLCKIQVHENQDPSFSEVVGKEGGWFLKLKGSDGKIKFHLVDQNRVKEMTIDPKMVDESLCNEESAKPFYVVCVVPAETMPFALNVSPQIDALATKACITSKINALKSARSLCVEFLTAEQKKVRHREDQVKKLDIQMGELLKISDMPTPYFLYAYGKHSADGQEFAWCVPFDLYDCVHAGSTVVAETKFGPASVVVTKIEKSAYLLGHKLIISMG